MNGKRIQAVLLVSMLVYLGVQSCTKEEPQQKSSRGFIDDLPIDQVHLDFGRRNPVYYVGEEISIRLKGPVADRFEVRDYWGEIIEKGSIPGDSITIKPQPPGWYKIYVHGNTAKKKKEAADLAAWNYRVKYGDCVAGTAFVVFRDNPNFPRLPAAEKYPRPGTDDEVMRGVSGMGPQRHSADASKPQESIARLEAEIAADRDLYLPFDTVRKRALMIAFGNGTKGHLDGVRKIVEHFKNDVKYYEPRNEPNGGSTGDAFLKNEMADFYNTVKSVDPSLKVIGPGTVTILADKSGLVFIEDFLKAGGANSIDGFSFHAYNCCNGDLSLIRNSMDGLMSLLKKYNADKKELWQTEQGYFACVYGSYQPRLQGRWTMLEMMAYEQYGLPKEHNHLWYDRSHGYWDFPTWWENDDDGFNPALPLMRVFSEELFGANFSRAYDLGINGNKLYIGSLFEGGTKHIAAFMSDGSTDGKVEVIVNGGPATLRLVSAFGVKSDVSITDSHATIWVPELPVYVELADGQTLEVIPQNFGQNLARADGVTLAASGTGAHPVNPRIPNDISKLNNGIMENGYYAGTKSGEQPWMDDTHGFPAWVEMRFPKPTQVGRVIVYAPVPWQWQGAPVDYELQYDDNGKWATIEHVIEPLKTFKVVTPSTRTKVDSFFSDRHVFQHEFKPVTTTKIRLLVHDTTFGGGATEEVEKAGGQTGPHHLALREIEAYAK